MEMQRSQQNIPRPKLRKKQGVGVDSISDDQKRRTKNPHIDTKSSSSPQLPRHLPPNVQRVNSAYKRFAPIISTRNPTPEKKDQSGRIVKNRFSANNLSNGERVDKDGSGGDFSILSSKKSLAQKNREEVSMLREQLDELQRKLLEKEDSFKSSQVTVDELKHQVCEKDAQLKSLHSELNTTKVKLADKQAALETLDWQIRVANKKVEKLQAETDSKDFEISVFMKFFEELMEKNTSTSPLPPVQNTNFDTFDHFPNIDVDETAIKEARDDSISQSDFLLKMKTSNPFLRADIKVFLQRNSFVKFTPRAVARIMHGVSSPSFPTANWSKCHFWGRYSQIDFAVVMEAARLELMNFVGKGET